MTSGLRSRRWRCDDSETAWSYSTFPRWPSHLKSIRYDEKCDVHFSRSISIFPSSSRSHLKDVYRIYVRCIFICRQRQAREIYLRLYFCITMRVFNSDENCVICSLLQMKKEKTISKSFVLFSFRESRGLLRRRGVRRSETEVKRTSVQSGTCIKYTIYRTLKGVF